jgi:guanylate kinase
MVLDIQGVDTIKEIMPEATSIFIKPDTMENLKTRIKQRPMSDEAFQKRWETATAEMSLADKYDYQIMNAEGKLVEAVNAVKEILNK